MKCFILAGGFATRLWPLTERRAKPLLPLAGRPILTHLVEGIPEHMSITVSTNAAFGEAFCAWASGTGRAIDVIVEHAEREGDKLGALGAVAQWVREGNIDDDILVLTGDNVLGFRMSDFLAAYQPGVPLVAGHDIGDLARASAFGTIMLGPDGRTVAAFEEKPEEPRSTLVSAGCFLLPAASLELMQAHAARHPDNIGSVCEALLAGGWHIRCFRFSEPWFDIGSFEAYLEATHALVGNRVLSAPRASAEGCVTDGSVVLGEGSIVRGSTMRDTVVFDRCVIEDCILERCVIDDDCVLRGVDLTGKMIRAGTRLERSTKGLEKAV